MKIEYRFVTGEKTAIEINGDFEEIILELDKEEYNCNRKETRRHKSLSLSDKSIENTRRQQSAFGHHQGNSEAGQLLCSEG